MAAESSLASPLSLPSRPGTYVLFLRLDRSRGVTVGRLGRFRFPEGVYAYVGSGRGAGGIAARVARHLRHPKPLHWHVDYFRAYAAPVRVWLAEGEQRRECAWVKVLAQMRGASLPVPGFGSSDCRCTTHLVHFPDLPDREPLVRAVDLWIREVGCDG